MSNEGAETLVTLLWVFSAPPMQWENLTAVTRSIESRAYPSGKYTRHNA